MALKDWAEVAPALALPIAGKVYTVPALSVSRGDHLARAFAGESDEPYNDYPLRQILLGCSEDCMSSNDPKSSCKSVYHVMRADNVPSAALSRATTTALVDWQSGREAAEHTWEHGLVIPGLNQPRPGIDPDGDAEAPADTPASEPAASAPTQQPAKRVAAAPRPGQKPQRKR